MQTSNITICAIALLPCPLQFHEQGYLALPGFASVEECKALQKRIAALTEQFDPQTVRSIFSTKNQVSVRQACQQEQIGTKQLYIYQVAVESSESSTRLLHELMLQHVSHHHE